MDFITEIRVMQSWTAVMVSLYLKVLKRFFGKAKNSASTYSAVVDLN